MNKRVLTALAVAAVAAVGIVAFELIAAEPATGGKTATTAPATCPVGGCGMQGGSCPMMAGGCCTMCKDSLTVAMTALDAAQKALDSGDKAAAGAQIAKAREALAKMQAMMAEAPPAGKFANARCPIMGSPIDAAKVPENLTRQYKGMNVAFCCGGCPAAWDKLTDAEKDAKLEAVMTTTTAPAAPGAMSGMHH